MAEESGSNRFVRQRLCQGTCADFASWLTHLKMYKMLFVNQSPSTINHMCVLLFQSCLYCFQCILASCQLCVHILTSELCFFVLVYVNSLANRSIHIQCTQGLSVDYIIYLRLIAWFPRLISPFWNLFKMYFEGIFF